MATKSKNTTISKPGSGRKKSWFTPRGHLSDAGIQAFNEFTDKGLDASQIGKKMLITTSAVYWRWNRIAA
jgi:hypothetical protein